MNRDGLLFVCVARPVIEWGGAIIYCVRAVPGMEQCFPLTGTRGSLGNVFCPATFQWATAINSGRVFELCDFGVGRQLIARTRPNTAIVWTHQG